MTVNRLSYSQILRDIIRILKKVQQLAKRIGIENISQPGIVKEMIMADILGHRLNPVKKQHDAEDPNDPSIRYEYLTCLEGKSFQFDRVDEENLRRRVLERNSAIFCAVFAEEDQLQVLRIYEVKPPILFEVLLEKYRRSKATSRHVGVPENWIRDNGILVYPQNNPQM